MADNWIYRIVVVGFVAILVAIVAGMITLPLLGKEMPSELNTLAMALITALAALLTPFAGGKADSPKQTT